MRPEEMTVEDTAKTAAEAHGVFAGTQSAQLLGFQASAMESHLRREALTFAVQTNSGMPSSAEKVLTDARAYLAFLKSSDA